MGISYSESMYDQCGDMEKHSQACIVHTEKL